MRHAEAGSGRPKALFLSKLEQHWNARFLEKFANHYDIEVVRILEHVRAHGYADFLAWLNDRVRIAGYGLILVDVEFFPGFALDMILRIRSNATIVLVTFDDIALHEINYINSFGCDLVTSGDPISVLKYREKGRQAEFLFLDNARRYFDPFASSAKDIDVLFFGAVTKGYRKAFIEGLKERGIRVNVHDRASGELAYGDLAKLICRARIVLNLSKTHAVPHEHAFVPVEHYLQFKGRITEAGLGGAVCISEYAPAIAQLFSPDLVPCFRTVEECAALIRDFLAEPARLQSTAERFRHEVLEKYEETKQVARLLERIAQLPAIHRSAPAWMPYRYVDMVATARFLTVRRPLGAWCRDVLDFLRDASAYPLAMRLCVLLSLPYRPLQRMRGRRPTPEAS